VASNVCSISVPLSGLAGLYSEIKLSLTQPHNKELHCWEISSYLPHDYGGNHVRIWALLYVWPVYRDQRPSCYTLSVQYIMLFPWQRLTRGMQVNTMMPYWCHFNQCRPMGGDKGSLSLETIETECVCVPFRGWMIKTKDVSAFERGMVVGCRAHRFVSRTATLLGFSCSTVSCVYQEWSTTQRTSRQVDTTVGSIGVNMGHHPCSHFLHLVESMPWRIEAVLRAKGGATQY
jgi:hypothetical protein